MEGELEKQARLLLHEKGATASPFPLFLAAPYIFIHLFSLLTYTQHIRQRDKQKTLVGDAVSCLSLFILSNRK